MVRLPTEGPLGEVMVIRWKSWKVLSDTDVEGRSKRVPTLIGREEGKIF